MEQHSPVMAILASASESDFANQIANALGYPAAEIVIGTPLSAIPALQARSASPTYILIDIGNRASDVLPEIDQIAEYCEADTRVVVMGQANDVNLYRELRQRGVLEYFTHPSRVSDIRNALMQHRPATAAQAHSGGHNGLVLAFISAASGDGGSTVAVNTAHSLARDFNQKAVIIDMDYQFGMLAKNLDLSTPFGIKELFDHPDRSIDSTLIDRMLVEYDNHFKIIAAPNDLRFWPSVRPEMISDLITILREKFQFVILDLPHIWSPWVSAALSNSTHIVMVAQLWLRSVTHSARLLNAMTEIGIDDEMTSLIINRSGAKFKEAVSSKDFERVCGKKAVFYLSNDIKAVVSAENQGKTIVEIGGTPLQRQFQDLARGMMTLKGGEQASLVMPAPEKTGLKALLKKR